MTLYDLKPYFQNKLRPISRWLFNRGITANQVTMLAAAVSVLLGVVLALYGKTSPQLFFMLPVWLFIRMALNAIDGILAKEFGQKSRLGAYLNELGDIVSDTALILPFAFLDIFPVPLVLLVVFLSILSEYTGVLAPMIGKERRYDGPMGKSDRALFFGALGAWLGYWGTIPAFFAIGLALVSLLLLVTISNRIRNVLTEEATIQPENIKA